MDHRDDNSFLCCGVLSVSAGEDWPEDGKKPSGKESCNPHICPSARRTREPEGGAHPGKIFGSDASLALGVGLPSASTPSFASEA
eukprot:1182790-Prorocentrum_minimum.AAC.1